MHEIRVDPITGRRTVIATDRDGRFDPSPPDGTEPLAAADPSPALVPDAPEPAPEANRDLYRASPARGTHEVIAAPQPVACLADLAPEALAAMLDTCRERMRTHDGAACLHLGVDEGAAASATQPPAHAELHAFAFVPADLARERERFGAYATQTMGANLLADLLQQEVRRRERVVAIDPEAVLLSAWAARVPYQLTLVPRAVRMRFEDDGPTGAALLHDGLNRLRRALGGMPPLNLWVRTAPRGAEHYCWRIDIMPRLVPPGGVELGTGIAVNPLAPESAAAVLRDAAG